MEETSGVWAKLNEFKKRITIFFRSTPELLFIYFLTLDKQNISTIFGRYFTLIFVLIACIMHKHIEINRKKLIDVTMLVEWMNEWHTIKWEVSNSILDNNMGLPRQCSSCLGAPKLFLRTFANYYWSTKFTFRLTNDSKMRHNQRDTYYVGLDEKDYLITINVNTCECWRKVWVLNTQHKYKKIWYAADTSSGWCWKHMQR